MPNIIKILIVWIYVFKISVNISEFPTKISTFLMKIGKFLWSLTTFLEVKDPSESHKPQYGCILSSIRLYTLLPCPQNGPYPFRNTLLINDVTFDLLLLFHVSQSKVQLYNNETEKKGITTS